MEIRPPGRLPHVGARSFRHYKLPDPLGYWDEGERLTISGPYYLLVAKQSFLQAFILFGVALLFLGFIIPHGGWLMFVGLGLAFGGVGFCLVLLRLNDALVTLTADEKGLTRVIDTLRGYREEETWEIDSVHRIFVSDARRPHLLLEASDGSARDLMLPGSRSDLEQAADLLNTAIRGNGGREFESHIDD